MTFLDPIITGPDNLPTEGGAMDQASHTLEQYRIISRIKTEIPDWFAKLQPGKIPAGELNLAIREAFVRMPIEGEEIAFRLAMLRLAKVIASNCHADQHLFTDDQERAALAVLATYCPLKAKRNGEERP